MKSQTSFIAAGAVLASAALGLAIVGHLPAASLGPEASPAVSAGPAAASAPPRVYCYSGMKSEEGRLTRGWVCEPEPLAATSH
jgi:hypothetical protein